MQFSRHPPSQPAPARIPAARKTKTRIRTASRKAAVARRLAGCLVFLAAAGSALAAETRRVPADYATIKAAVAAARDGDTVEIADGIYLEDNIVLSKRLRVLARRPFGATVYGSFSPDSALFLVRAPVEIGGLVLKNADYGIVQRDSPDVAWTGHDLAVLNMKICGIIIDAREGNIGSADLSNLILDKCHIGIATNDARRLEVKGALVTNCRIAFQGSDHLLFRVDDSVVWDCGFSVPPDEPPGRRSGIPFVPGATSKIVLGPSVVVLDGGLGSDAEISRAVNALPEPNRLQRAMALLVLAEILLGDGEGPRAEWFFKRSLAVSPRADTSEISWRSLFGLGRVRELAGDAAGALDSYRRAAAAIERQILTLPPQVFRGGYFDDKMKVYEALLRLLVRYPEGVPPPEAVEEAFFYAERSKARGFLFALEEAGGGAERDPEGIDKARGKEIVTELSRVRAALQAGGLKGSERKELLERLTALEAEHEARFIEARRGRPGLDRMPAQAPISITEIRARLPDDESALVEYFVGEESSIAFWLTRRELRAAVLPGAEVLRPLVANGIDFLSFRGSGGFRGRAGARRLFETLLGPFADRLMAVKRLIVVPAGPLFALPFEALVIDAGNGAESLSQSRSRTAVAYGADRFLVEDHEVSYAPSATVFARLEGRTTAGPFPMDLLAVAAPRAALVSGPAGDFELPRLPFAEREARSIARLFPRARSRVLAGPRATEAELRRQDLGRFRILHFAVHGLLDEQYWWRSALLLTPEAGTGEDGRLDPLEINSLAPRAELVMLSACRTAEGKVQSGEGLLGLSAAFLTAGAESVVSSLWSVNDRSTARFMTSFYGYLADGSTKAEALRRAKVEMIGSRFRHPYYWAAFVLSGDRGRARR